VGAPKERFQARLIEGHKGVVVAPVPFDPEERWRRKPVKLAGRRHGWLVKGTLGKTAFDGFIGERWGRFFVILEPSIRQEAGVEVGDDVSLVVAPTATRGVFARAFAQSKATTQPGQARFDAVDFAAPTRRHGPSGDARERPHRRPTSRRG
jgi:hypothetical protein